MSLNKPFSIAYCHLAFSKNISRILSSFIILLVLVIGREIALPVWLVDVLINISTLLFFVVSIELLIRIKLYFFVYEIVGIENDDRIIVGFLHLF